MILFVQILSRLRSYRGDSVSCVAIRHLAFIMGLPVVKHAKHFSKGQFKVTIFFNDKFSVKKNGCAYYLSGNIEYTCPANNDCEINKRRRKACQACRFRKCLQMGMLKEGVRLDRVRGGRQKYRRNPNVSPYQLPASSTSMNRVQSLEDIKLLDTLASFEPEPLSIGNCGIDLQNRNSIDSHQSNDSRNNMCDAQEMLSVLSDLYDRELVGVIGWAKQIPGMVY